MKNNEIIDLTIEIVVFGIVIFLLYMALFYENGVEL